MLDAYEAMMNVTFNDAVFEEDGDDWNVENWRKKEKFNPEFCVGKEEQLSIATKSIRILAGIRKRSGK